MTKAQQEFVLEMLSMVSADLYDRSDYEKTRSSEQAAYEIMNRAFGLFPRREAGDFVEPGQMPKDREVALVGQYEAFLKYGMTKRSEIAKEHAGGRPGKYLENAIGLSSCHRKIFKSSK